MSLPRAEGMEKSVLSSILQEPSLLDDAKEAGICKESFHGSVERLLWVLINERAAHGRSLELVGIVQDLQDSTKLAALGGPSGVAEVYSYATTSAHFNEHIAGIKEKHALREAHMLATRLINKIENNADVNTVTSLLGQPVTHVHELLQGKVQGFSVGAAVDRFEDYLSAIMAGKSSPSMQTGISGLDRVYGGLLQPSYNIVTAVPGTGKTAWLVDLMHGLSTRGKRGGFFSCEMTERQLMKRLVIRASGLQGWKIGQPQTYTLKRDEMIQIKQTMADIKATDFFIHDEPRIHIDKLCTIARKEHKQRPLDYLLIDYAQLMQGNRAKGDTQEREYADISNKLQGLMKELGCALVLLSQVTKNPNNGTIATKGGKVFTDDADIWLHIEDGAKNVEVAKCRHHGHTGRQLNVHLNKDHQRFDPN